MLDDYEKREKEIFDEMTEKQSAVAKKALLGALCGLGFVFAVLGIIFLLIVDFEIIGMVFAPLGLFFIALGVILFFVIPAKFDYGKYKERVKKYGYTSTFDLYLKLAELEARVEELEKNK